MTMLARFFISVCIVSCTAFSVQVSTFKAASLRISILGSEKNVLAIARSCPYNGDYHDANVADTVHYRSHDTADYVGLYTDLYELIMRYSRQSYS